MFAMFRSFGRGDDLGFYEPFHFFEDVPGFWLRSPPHFQRGCSGVLFTCALPSPVPSIAGSASVFAPPFGQLALFGHFLHTVFQLQNPPRSNSCCFPLAVPLTRHLSLVSALSLGLFFSPDFRIPVFLTTWAFRFGSGIFEIVSSKDPTRPPLRSLVSSLFRM